MKLQIAARHAPLGHSVLVGHPPPDAHFTLHQAACITQTAGGIAVGILILIASLYGIGVSLYAIDAKKAHHTTWLESAGTIVLHACIRLGVQSNGFNRILAGLIRAATIVEMSFGPVTGPLTTIRTRMKLVGTAILRAYAWMGWYGSGFHQTLKWVVWTGAAVEGGFTVVAVVLARVGVRDDVVLLVLGGGHTVVTSLTIGMLAIQALGRIWPLPKFTLRQT